MKFSCTKSLILSAIKHLDGSVEKRNASYILSCVKIDASIDGGVTFTTTNLDAEASESLKCSVEVAGSVAVHMSTFSDIIRSLRDGSIINVTLKISKDNSTVKLLIESGKAKFEISTISASEFPSFASGDFSTSFDLQTQELRSIIKKTYFSICTDESRFNLNGLLFHTEEVEKSNKLFAASTDGHRLSVSSVVVPGDVKLKDKIVPKKAIDEVLKLVNDYENSKISIAFSDNKVRFLVGEVKYITKLVDGTFPDYKKVVPEKNKKFMDLEREVALDIFSRISVINKISGSKAIKLDISAESLKVSAENSDGLTGSDTVDCVFGSDEFLSISFNSKYLIDALSSMSNGKIRFKLSDTNSPVLIESVDNNDSYYVVMSVRT